MNTKSVRVTIPASTANLGPGFDAVGMAFQLYTTIEMRVSEVTDIRLHGSELGSLPIDKSNLIYQVAASLFQQAGMSVPELYIEASSDIPLTRGLGSSAAAIVGGLVAANQLAGEPFSHEELFAVATKLEGHPDNAGASLFGGIVVATMPDMADEPVPYVRFLAPPSMQALVIIPDFRLSTDKARHVLPKVYTKEDVIYNVGHSSLLVAALVQGRLDLLAQAMRDRLHQPYRAQMVPGLTEILQEAPQHGALGAALSGAGPTILCLLSGNVKQELLAYIDDVMGRNKISYKTMLLQPDERGVQVEIRTK